MLESGHHLSHGGGEGCMKHQGAGGGVTEEVRQLVVTVPVVNVEGRAPGPERAHHHVEVLGAVVEKDPDVILA